MTALQAPETKSAEAAAFDEYARVVEAYKETNDARLAEIEARLSPDVVSEEKLARINEAVDQAHRRIDRVTLDARRPALGAAAADARDPAVAEHKRAFQDYVRTGEAAGLKRLEAKALSAGSGPDGGYLVPDTVEREVLRRLANISPIRAVASVRTISGGLYKRAFSTAGPATGWGRWQPQDKAMRLSLYEQLHHDRAAARRARLEAEHRECELTRLRHELASIRLSFARVKLKLILEGKYRPDQPRVPAGNPDSSHSRVAALRHRTRPLRRRIDSGTRTGTGLHGDGATRDKPYR
jgi:hypothetical protein